MSLSYDLLPEVIETERQRRRLLAADGKPYHHWQALGQKKLKYEEVWCDYCVGYFWWEHLGSHKFDRLCWHVPEVMRGLRDCPCIDCFAARALFVLAPSG